MKQCCNVGQSLPAVQYYISGAFQKGMCEQQVQRLEIESLEEAWPSSWSQRAEEIRATDTNTVPEGNEETVQLNGSFLMNECIIDLG